MTSLSWFSSSLSASCANVGPYSDEECDYMESRGECERNRDAMSRSCRRTCQRCVDVPDGCIDISPDHNGGIYKCVLQSGYGDERAPAGSVIYSHYHGELPDGSVFGTSRDAGRMWTYNIGVSTYMIVHVHLRLN